MFIHNRYNENRTEIQELLNKESYKDVDLLLPYPQEPDILPIATAIERLKNVREYTNLMILFTVFFSLIKINLLMYFFLHQTG